MLTQSLLGQYLALGCPKNSFQQSKCRKTGKSPSLRNKPSSPSNPSLGLARWMWRPLSQAPQSIGRRTPPDISHLASRWSRSSRTAMPVLVSLSPKSSHSGESTDYLAARPPILTLEKRIFSKSILKRGFGSRSLRLHGDMRITQESGHSRRCPPWKGVLGGVFTAREVLRSDTPL